MKLRLNFSQQHYKKRRWISLLLLLLSLGLIALNAWEAERSKSLKEEEILFQTRIDRITEQQEQLRATLRTLGHPPDDASFKTLQEEIGFANQLIFRKTFYWTQFLSDLELHVPKQVAIRQIQPSFGSGRVKVEVEGEAKTLKALTQLIVQLQSDLNFDNVHLLKQKMDRKAPVQDAILFSIQFHYLRGESALPAVGKSGKNTNKIAG